MLDRLFRRRPRTAAELRSALRRCVNPYETKLDLDVVVAEIDRLRDELTGAGSREVLLEQALRQMRQAVSVAFLDPPRPHPVLQIAIDQANRLLGGQMAVVREGERLGDARPLDRRTRSTTGGPDA